MATFQLKVGPKKDTVKKLFLLNKNILGGNLQR